MVEMQGPHHNCGRKVLLPPSAGLQDGYITLQVHGNKETECAVSFRHSWAQHTKGFGAPPVWNPQLKSQIKRKAWITDVKVWNTKPAFSGPPAPWSSIHCDKEGQMFQTGYIWSPNLFQKWPLIQWLAACGEKTSMFRYRRSGHLTRRSALSGPNLVRKNNVKIPRLSGDHTVDWECTTSNHSYARAYARTHAHTHTHTHTYIYIYIYIYTGSAKKMYTHFNERKRYAV